MDLTTYLESIANRIKKIQELWCSIFGKDFKDTWENANFDNLSLKNKTINGIINETKIILNNKGKRSGNVSVFLRDQFSDRLYLHFSTEDGLNPPAKYDDCYAPSKNNYDEKKQMYFYQLKDKLHQGDKSSKKVRKERGLTGWVAVTGFPLIVNSERSKELLEKIDNESADLRSACDKYGKPEWGRHVSEEKIKNNEIWSKRFIAVPIKSVNKESSSSNIKHLSIGVIRYTCPINSPELIELDQVTLGSIADIIASIINLIRLRIVTSRNEKLKLEELHLSKAGDINRFLEFLLSSLTSKITSVYLLLKDGSNEILRLFDVCGISNETPVGALRKKIKDYDSQKLGLTWEIYKNRDGKPQVFDSVAGQRGWKGLNDKLFYTKHFEEIGIDLSRMEDENTRKKILDNYSIKLMGVKLEHNNPVGVVKVEFPSIFDTSQIYDESDKIFLSDCANILAKELRKYQSFINGSWFNNNDDGENKVKEFIYLLRQVIRTQIITKDEYPSFWENVKNYQMKHKKVIYNIENNLEKIKLTSSENKFLNNSLNQIKNFIPETVKAVIAHSCVEMLIGHSQS